MNRRDFNTLRRIRKRILWEKWFFNRGKSIWSDLIELLTLTTIVGLFVDKLNTYFGTNIPISKAMMAVPLVMILYWITGRLDFTRLHLIQIENEIALTANPALFDRIKRMDRRIKKISKNTRDRRIWH